MPPQVTIYLSAKIGLRLPSQALKVADREFSAPSVGTVLT